MRNIFLLSVFFCISACQTIDSDTQTFRKLSSPTVSSRDIYTIKKGDSLWSIAKENNISIEKILELNPNIRSNTVFPGDKIIIHKTAKSEQFVAWSFPVKRSIKKSSSGSWIFFQGNGGEAISAAKAGKVVAAGAVIPGYGNIILIEHKDQYLSFYGHLKEILVNPGDSVSEGEIIASLGQTEASRPMLRFQIRHQGVPLSPSKVNFL